MGRAIAVRILAVTVVILGSGFAAQQVRYPGSEHQGAAFDIKQVVPGVYHALGMNGQSLFIHRPARTAIAKFSTFPAALDWDRFALHHAGMAALCEWLATSR